MKKVWVQIDPEVQKVVPKVPTKEMIDAACSCDPERESMWSAYLSAAPTVPHLESADKVIHDACQSLMPAVQVTQKSYSQPIGEIEARALEEAAEKFEGWLDQVVYELRQLAAQKRAAAGEGK